MELVNHPTDPTMYEVIPTPDADVDLLPGDEVWMQYQLIDLGTWLVAYQVGKIEERIEADGRFRLDSYHYDEANKEITFKCRVREQPEIRMQLAGAFGWGVLSGIIITATFAFVYKASEVVTVYRKKSAIMASPTMTDAEKQKAIEAIDAEDGSLLGSGWGLSGGMGLMALAVLAYLVWGRR